MNYKDLFVKLKLDDIRNLANNAKRYSSEKIVQVELDRVMTVFDHYGSAIGENNESTKTI